MRAQAVARVRCVPGELLTIASLNTRGIPLTGSRLAERYAAIGAGFDAGDADVVCCQEVMHRRDAGAEGRGGIVTGRHRAVDHGVHTRQGGQHRRGPVASPGTYSPPTPGGRRSNTRTANRRRSSGAARLPTYPDPPTYSTRMMGCPYPPQAGLKITAACGFR